MIASLHFLLTISQGFPSLSRWMKWLLREQLSSPFSKRAYFEPKQACATKLTLEIQMSLFVMGDLVFIKLKPYL